MEAPEAYVNFTGASKEAQTKPSTIRGEQAATTTAWLGAITTRIISTIDWSLNTWGVIPLEGGLSPLVIPAARFGAQTRALPPILQAPFGTVAQPDVTILTEDYKGPTESIIPGAIKARAWRRNSTDVICVLVAMVNTQDCSNKQPMWPRPKCGADDASYKGSIHFSAQLKLAPHVKALERIFAYDENGHPASNYSLAVSKDGRFEDSIGGGATNLYLSC